MTKVSPPILKEEAEEERDIRGKNSHIVSICFMPSILHDAKHVGAPSVLPQTPEIDDLSLHGGL